MSRMHRHRLKPDARRHDRFRLLFQIFMTAVWNGYAAGYFGKGLYTGKLKLLCVPVLNCYSCPGAWGSCPIGAMQAVAGGAKHTISFYVLGMLVLFGTLLGRLVCGFLCPFGLLQDLLAKLPFPKLRIPTRIDRILRYLKYAVLLGMVLLLPALAGNAYGIGEPWFCKYLCPAGTLGGGIPQLLLNEPLRRMVGALFHWKAAVLVLVVTGSLLIPRVFCRYLCPLGAFYALFSRFTLYQMHVDTARCTGCGNCDTVCPMAVDVRQGISGTECIRCGKCKAACPAGAVQSGMSPKPDAAPKRNTK